MKHFSYKGQASTGRKSLSLEKNLSVLHKNIKEINTMSKKCIDSETDETSCNSLEIDLSQLDCKYRNQVEVRRNSFISNKKSDNLENKFNNGHNGIHTNFNGLTSNMRSSSLTDEEIGVEDDKSIHNVALKNNLISITKGNGYSNNLNSAYNVHHDLLLRVAMQNGAANGNVPIFHSSSVNSNLGKVWNAAAAAAAVVANNANNPQSTAHSLYQSALANSTATTSASTLVNTSINAAQNLVALNQQNAFHTLQQQSHQQHSSHVLQQQQLPQHSQPIHSNQHQQSNNVNTTNHLPASTSINQSSNNHHHLLSINSANTSLLAAQQTVSIAPHILTETTSSLANSTVAAVAANITSNNLNSCLPSITSSTNTNSASNTNDHLLAASNALMNPTSSFINSHSTFVSSSTLDGAPTTLVLTSLKKRKRSPQPIPQNCKDEAYWDRRRRNNESAKRSREMRRIKEHQTSMRLIYLEQENLRMATEIEMMRKEAEKMHDLIYTQRRNGDNQ